MSNCMRSRGRPVASPPTWRAAGEQVAVATVTETWGSSPRPAGSQMAVTESGKHGRLGLAAAASRARSPRPRMKTIGDRHAAAARFRRHQRDGLGSRPRLRRQGEGVRGETVVTPELLARAARQAQRGKRPVVLATRLPGRRADPAARARRAARAARGGDAQALRRRRERHGRSSAARSWFLHVHNPPQRLIVVGAVHIAQALVPFAAAARLRRHRGRSAPLLRHRRALSRRHHLDRMAGRGDGRARARHPHRRRHADARSEARRPRARPRAEIRRPSISARSARGGPMPRGSSACASSAMTRPRSPASAARSASNIEAVTAPEIALSILAEIVAVRRGAALAGKQAIGKAA